MPEALTPAGGRRAARAHRHARDPARHRAAAGVHGGARRARRLGRPADLRGAAARLVGGLQAPERPLPLGFFGPVERALRDQGANISFAPADFRRFEPLLEQQAPRVMATVAAPPDDAGLVQPLAARRRHGQGAGPRRRRPRAAAGGRGLAAVSRAPSACRPTTPTPSTSTRSTSWSSRGGAVRAPRARAGRGRRRDRRARAALHPRRRDAADRDRRDPLGDRRPARRGRRRRLRRPLGDVHQRAHAPARGGQGHQPQGPVRRRLGRDLRRRLARALRLARRQRRGRVPAGRGRQLARPDRAATG